MYTEGQILVINEKGAKQMNERSAKYNQNINMSSGDKVIVRETDDVPFCTPLSHYKEEFNWYFDNVTHPLHDIHFVEVDE